MSQSSMDKAYQHLFDVCTEAITLYTKCSTTEPSGALQDVNPRTVEKELLAYKDKYDTTKPDVHVDVACELYDSVKSSVSRGYLCNSWLKNEKSCLYFGISYDDCDNTILRLDKIFAMLEYLRRISDDYLTQALTLRNRFFYYLYSVFLETQKMKGEAPPAVLLNLENKMNEILEDAKTIPRKPDPRQAPAGGGAWSSLFGSGLSEIMSNFKNALPEVVNMMGEHMKERGKTVPDDEKAMLNTAVSNLTSLLDKPENIQKMLQGMGNSGDALKALFQQVLPQAPSTAAAGGAGPAPPPPPSIEDKKPSPLD